MRVGMRQAVASSMHVIARPNAAETNSRVWRRQNRANGVASRSSRQLQLAAPVSLDFSKGLSCRPTAKSILPSYLEIWQCQIFAASSLVYPKTLELMVSSRRSRLLHKQVAKTAAVC